ncbi:MAG: PKD domain-containing protein [Cytophagaceae bacterium]
MKFSTLINVSRNYTFLLILFTGMHLASWSNAQISPYSLSPDWAFGDGGRAIFPSGSFPSSGAPTYGSRVTNTVPSPEASTSVCFSNGDVALYTNTTFAYNGASAGSWSNFIRNFNNTGDNTCASSSTGGGIAFPDPASPSNAFYLVLANDETGGNCTGRGVNLYRFTGTGTNVVYNAGPTQLAPGSFPGEAITGGTDGQGGYWVIIHDKTATNTFRVWRFTSTGMTGPTNYTVGANVTNTTSTQSYLKLSPCQDKIAYHSGGIVVVHSFNRSTGAVGGELRRFNTTEGGVGLEFSPDGNRIYYNGAGALWTGGLVRYVDIATGTVGTVAGSASWSLQMGPDGKIYTSPTGTNIGIISNPNGAATYSTAALPSGASIFRGLSNMVWLSPNTPSINASVTGCNANFNHIFRNYFLDNVTANPGTFTWNFGDGNTSNAVAPSHNYTAPGNYNVTVSFNDAVCGHTWTASTTVNTGCITPVTWLNISAQKVNGNIELTWTTSSEINNDYFEVQVSEDGINFQTIGYVKSKGDSKELQFYKFTDTHSYAENLYYRLIQHDFNGEKEISPQAHIRLINSSVKIHPNPSSDQFEINISGTDFAEIILTDVLGRILYNEKYYGENLIKTSLGQDFAKGTYLIKVFTGDQTFVDKLVKK